MTEDRKRAEDVYELVEDLMQRVNSVASLQALAGGEGEFKQRLQEHEQLMVDVPEIKDTVDVMADVVIGPKIPDPNRPNEWKMNGKGRYERDANGGLAHMTHKLRWQNQLWKFVGQLAAILTGVALIVKEFG